MCSSFAPPPMEGATSLIRLWTVPRVRRTVEPRKRQGARSHLTRGSEWPRAGHVGCLPLRWACRSCSSSVGCCSSRPERPPAAADLRAWRVRRHPARRGDVRRSDVRRRVRVHADLRVDAHGQHGPRRIVPAGCLHRHRVAAEDGRQVTQPRTRGRQPCRRGSCRCSSVRQSSAILGVVIQQVFLRWNQGQDLRQALITVAIAVIMADQMLAHFGGLAQRMIWPGAVTHFIEIFGQRYATSRLFMLGVATARRRAVVAVAEQDADGPRHPGRVSTTKGWFERWASTSASCSP